MTPHNNRSERKGIDPMQLFGAVLLGFILGCALTFAFGVCS